jgi:hypothetical protein
VNQSTIIDAELVLNAVLITFADGLVTLVQSQQIYDSAVSEEFFLQGLPASATADRQES